MSNKAIQRLENSTIVAYDLKVSIDGIFEGQLRQYESVWPPYSAQYFLEQLQLNGIFDLMRGKRGVDLGSASGLLGLAVKAQGSSHIIFLDNQADAVKNAGENAFAQGLVKGVDKDYLAMQSDSLDALKNLGIRVDFIMGNLPMNPKARGVHDDKPRMKANQNGDESDSGDRWGDGNYVLLRTISESREVLEENGFIVVTASSRQGVAEFEAALDANYKGCWYYANANDQGEPGYDEQLNMEYHGPFISHWIARSKDELVDQDPNTFFRVFHKDAEGNPYLVTEGKMYETVDDKRQVVSAVKTIFYRDGKKYVHVKNGREYLVCLTDDEQIELTDEWRNRIPVRREIEPFFHRYYIIVAKKEPAEEIALKLPERLTSDN